MSESSGDIVNVLLQENAQYEFTFQLSDTSSGFMDHRVFFNGASLTSPNVEVVVADDRQLTLNFTSAQETYEGVYQVELENLAGIVSVYLCCKVNGTYVCTVCTHFFRFFFTSLFVFYISFMVCACSTHTCTTHMSVHYTYSTCTSQTPV